MYITMNMTDIAPINSTYLVPGYRNCYRMDYGFNLLYVIWIDTDDKKNILKINTLNLSDSYSYTQVNHRTFYSMSLDTNYLKLVLGGILNNGDILITKTPLDKISTESFLQIAQNLNMVNSTSNEYNLITYATASFTSLVSESATANSNPFVDIDADSDIDEMAENINKATEELTEILINEWYQ